MHSSEQVRGHSARSGVPSQGQTDLQKVVEVNAFFNRLKYVSDSVLWKRNDYWATPEEFLQLGAGDCEDFAIAKYFALLELGVEESKLRMAEVRALELKQPHMVLLYFDARPGDESPLVLDNLTSLLLPLSERVDLSLWNSFNRHGFWLPASDRDSGAVAGLKVPKWEELMSRI